MIVLDSSAAIELLRGTSLGEKIREKLETEAAATTTITVHELMANARETEKEKLLEFLGAFEILPYAQEAAFKSAEIEQQLKKKGKTIGKLDIFMAAICIVHSLPLLTLDKDFAQVPELKRIQV